MPPDFNADVVAVVRCKNCQFGSYNPNNGNCRCVSQRGLFRIVSDDEYCSFGEARLDE